MKRLLNIFWCVPALLMWAAFPPCGEKFDIFFAFAPLLWCARRFSRRKASLVWFANGLAFWIGTLAWMPAIVKNGGPWPLVVLGWFALSAYCAAYFAAFGFLSASIWRWAKDGAYAKRLFAILFAEPILWAGLEIVRSRLFGGFSWNQAGVPLVVAGFGDLAALGGVYLTSAAVILVAGTLASAADRIADSMTRTAAYGVPRALRSIETLLPLAAVFALYACAKNFGAGAPASSQTLQAALVQRNFPCVFAAREPKNPYEEYKRLFAAIAPLRPSLVVLPESAFGEFGAIGSAGVWRFARSALEKCGAQAIIGGGSRRDEARRLYNSAAVYSPEGLGDIYDKAHLVPFGEFIPGDKLVTALQRLAPVGSCSPGELKTVEAAGARLGIAICFEDTDSAQIRKLAAQGAQALVFITNDSWFAHSCETLQHAWQAVARAIETGLPVLRTGNSGVTGTISPSGAAVWLGDESGAPLIDAQGTMAAKIALASPGRRTPYVTLGDAPLFCAFLAILALCFIGGRPHS